jgi:hypothetical protein
LASFAAGRHKGETLLCHRLKAKGWQGGRAPSSYSTIYGQKPLGFSGKPRQMIEQAPQQFHVEAKCPQKSKEPTALGAALEE